jgi:hydrogenase maturation protease
MSRTPPPRARPRVVVASVGNPWRGDDGVGPVVTERARRLASGPCPWTDLGALEDPFDLLGRWDGAELAVVVDATRSGAAAGTLSLFVLDPEAAPEGGYQRGATSTHGLGIADVHRIARAVGCSPGRTVVIGVEGESFEHRWGLSPAVEEAVDDAARAVVEEVHKVAPCA